MTRSCVSVALVLSALSSSVAHAEPDPDACTTTVRCTGTMAPYATPTPPSVAVPPPSGTPAAPPTVAPTVPPAPAVVYLNLDRPTRDGQWRTVVAPDGSVWHERQLSSTPVAGVWGTGLALLTGSYLGGLIASIDQGNPIGTLPVFGAFTNAAFTDGNARLLWALDGVAQAGGLVALLVGLAAGPPKLERRPVSLGAAFIPHGGGVSAQGRF